MNRCKRKAKAAKSLKTVVEIFLYIMWTFCSVSVNMDLISAKELLVLAQTADEQKQWVLYLSKKIVRKEPKIKSASVRWGNGLGYGGIGIGYGN